MLYYTLVITCLRCKLSVLTTRKDMCRSEQVVRMSFALCDICAPPYLLRLRVENQGKTGIHLGALNDLVMKNECYFLYFESLRYPARAHAQNFLIIYPLVFNHYYCNLNIYCCPTHH